MIRRTFARSYCVCLSLAAWLCSCSEGSRVAQKQTPNYSGGVAGTDSHAAGANSAGSNSANAGNSGQTIATAGSSGNASAGVGANSGGSGGSAGAGNSSGGTNSAGVANVAGAAGGGVVNPCSAEEAAMLATPKLFTPDHENFRVMGRIDATNPTKLAIGAAGVTIFAKFRGSSLGVQLSSNAPDYFDVLIDDQVVKLKVSLTKTAFAITPQMPLACGDHTLQLVKRTQASIDITTFLGIEVGALLKPDELPTRKIEVIGDSITCGEGDDATTADPCVSGSWSQTTHNARLAWGAVLGRLFHAQVYNTCVGGIGLTRNYENNATAIPMPKAYVKTHPVSQATSSWATAQDWIDPTQSKQKYQPDAIIIGLGTNDFSPGDSSNPYRPMMDPQAFADAYVAFIEQLRGYYGPDVRIYYTDSPILGDGYPTSDFKSRTDFMTALGLLDAYYAAHPELKVKQAPGGKQLATGCNGHPGADAQAKTAANIAKVVGSDMGW